MKLPKTGRGLLALIVLGALWIMGQYNGLVGLDEDVEKEWANVESQYQRRADLIPQLVSTVKGFANQELEVFTDVTEARAKATQTTVDIDDAESFAKFQAAQGEVSSALSRLLVTVENYPQLKSDQNFLSLQKQLEGTENRIQVARRNFNEMVNKYDKAVREAPRTFVARLFGFNERGGFEAQEGSEIAPEVDFDFERE